MRNSILRSYTQHLLLYCRSSYRTSFDNTARVRPQQVLLRHLKSSAQSPKLAANSRDSRRRKEASYSPYLVLFALVAGTAVIVDCATNPAPREKPIGEEAPHPSTDERTPAFADMPIPQGSLGNLTPDQEQKLKEFWAITLKTFGVKDPIEADAARPITPATSATLEPESAKKEKKHGLFQRKQRDSVNSPTSPRFGSGADPEDKYGQTKELQEILANSSASDLREAFWSMVKKDHPDALLLRFLRARKWNVQRALAMLISTMHWRRNEMRVDDDIMKYGEGGALADSQSSDAAVKREGTDFLAQLRIGKSFIHGVDKEGRPICFVRVRLHRGGEQTERALERYTVYLIETCRLALQPPVETAVSVLFSCKALTTLTGANRPSFST